MKLTPELINEKVEQLRKELLAKLKEPKLEVNKWYKHNAGKYLKWFVFLKEDGEAYGINAAGCWFTDNDMESYITTYGCILATLQEVQQAQQALEAEAIKRGFKKGVIIDKSKMDYNCEKKIWILNSDKFEYCHNENSLQMGDDYVFYKGVWASVIPKEKTTADWVNEYGKQSLRLREFLQDNNLKITKNEN